MRFSVLSVANVVVLSVSLRMKRVIGLLLVTAMTAASAQELYTTARAKMVGEINALARNTAAETGRSVFSLRVMNAMGTVERHRFVAAGDEANA